LSAGLEGLLLLDKPQGPTSHDIVALMRRVTGTRRMGHAGTLDPMASGLLPLVLGRATRLVRFLPYSPKDYQGTLQLGLTSNTDDITGEISNSNQDLLPDVAAVLEAAAEFIGCSRQVPPAVSARKVEGQRMYKLARRGISVEAAASEVEIERFELRSEGKTGLFSFEARVSGGTYIRALVRDLGARLGCGGVLTSLRRTAIGPMRPDADPGQDLRALEKSLIPLERMPLDLPDCRLESEREAERFAAGVRFTLAAAIAPSGLCKVLSPRGFLLGVGETREGKLQPKVVLPPPV
jgi:tRNA pseudouridine55 synthase